MPHVSVKSSISGGYIFSFISFAILQFSPALKKWVYHYHSSSSSEVFWTKNSKHIKKEASVTLSFYYILIQFCLFWSMTINFVWSRFHYSQIVHFLQNSLYGLFYYIFYQLRENCPNTEFFLVRIFLYLYRIRRLAPRISVFSSANTGIYGPEKTPYLDTFHAVIGKYFQKFCLLDLLQFFWVTL